MAYETVLVYISPPCFRETNTMQAFLTFLKRDMKEIGLNHFKINQLFSVETTYFNVSFVQVYSTYFRGRKHYVRLLLFFSEQRQKK